MVWKMPFYRFEFCIFCFNLSVMDLPQPAAKHHISPHCHKTSVEIKSLIKKEGGKNLPR